MQQWRRTPGIGRYAHPERERRFLVKEDVARLRTPLRIEDRYIDGTSLRVRRLTAEGKTVQKLTQKIRSDPADPSRLSITTIYLTAGEYDLLAALPAAQLSKARYVRPVDGVRFVIDVFDDALTGLRLAEVEVTDLAAPLVSPSWLGEEVTYDDRYSGGRLARTSAADVEALLIGRT